MTASSPPEQAAAHTPPHPSAWERYWFGPGPAVRLDVFRIGIMALVWLYLYAYGDAYVLPDADRFGDGLGRTWNPIFLFEALGIRPIDGGTARWVFYGAHVALGCALLGIATRLACAAVALIFLYWIGLAYSFGKPHHDMTALAFAVCSLPLGPVGRTLSLDSLWRRRPAATANIPLALLSIRLTQITIAIGYGAAGLSKLWIAGFEWCNGYTLQGIMLGHNRPGSLIVGSSQPLAQVMSIGCLAVQTLFPLVLVWPALRWFFVPAAVSFHLGTWWTMDTGPYMSLWFCMIAFVRWDRVPGWFRGMWARKPFGPMAAATVTVAPTALVLYVFHIYWGWWVWAAVPVLAWALLRGRREP